MAGVDRGRDWSQLNLDLLELIVGELTEISDHFRVRAVCRSWRSVPRYIAPPCRGPWLLLLPTLNSPQQQQQEEDCHIISPFDNWRRFTLRTPYSVKMKSSHYVYGSQCGYFLLIDDVTRSVSITNPVVARDWFTIPPPLPKPGDRWIKNAKVFRDDNYKLNVIVSVSSEDEMIPFLWRTGDSAWTEMDKEDKDGRDISDFVLYKGSFYLVNLGDRTVVINSTTLAKTCEIFHPESEIYIDNEDDDTVYEFYLVESSGKLLMVVWDLLYTMWVFQLDLSEQQPKWVRVRSIGKDTLFLYEGSVMCFPNGEMFNFRKNTVYFIPTYGEEREVNMFNIEDDTVEYLPDNIGSRRPVWFIPTYASVEESEEPVTAVMWYDATHIPTDRALHIWTEYTRAVNEAVAKARASQPEVEPVIDTFQIWHRVHGIHDLGSLAIQLEYTKEIGSMTQGESSSQRASPPPTVEEMLVMINQVRKIIRGVVGRLNTFRGNLERLARDVSHLLGVEDPARLHEYHQRLNRIIGGFRTFAKLVVGMEAAAVMEDVTRQGQRQEGHDEPRDGSA